MRLLYLPHIPISSSDIEDLINELPPAFLLLGDMNAKHELWGEITNEKGPNIFELLSNSDIYLN